MQQEPDRGTVLVTGASSGIGREIAKAFAARGFHAILVARRREMLEDLAQELKRSKSATITILPADLNDPGAPRAIFEHLNKHGVAVDTLVNNAGITFEGDFASTPLEDHLHLLQLNVVALTTLTRLFLDPMLKRARGRILNVSSLAAFVPVPSMAAYAASKAYVLTLSEALSEELRGTGVTITALCPGLTATPMVRRSRQAERIPSVLMMDAAEVARQGVAACLSGRPVHVPGLPNTAFAEGIRLFPRGVTRAFSGLLTRQMR